MTLHTSPAPPHPSHSLLMTLRLLHHPTPIPALRLRAIRAGSIAYFGPDVEGAAMQTLADICRKIGRKSREGMGKVRLLKQQQQQRAEYQSEAASPFAAAPPVPLPPDSPGQVDAYILQQLEALWTEQAGIVRSVLKRIRQGDTDW